MIAGILLYLVLDAIAQLLPPHYNPITQSESALAVGPYGYVYTINFLVRTVFSLVFIIAFVRTIKAEGRDLVPFNRGIDFFAMWAVGATVLAVFPTDVPSTPISGHGAIHLVATVVTFTGGAIGVYLLSRSFGKSAALRDARSWALPLATLCVILLGAEVIGGILVQSIAGSVGGLIERLFIGSVLLWVFLVSLFLARRAGRSRG